MSFLWLENICPSAWIICMKNMTGTRPPERPCGRGVLLGGLTEAVRSWEKDVNSGTDCSMKTSQKPESPRQRKWPRSSEAGGNQLTPLPKTDQFSKIHTPCTYVGTCTTHLVCMFVWMSMFTSCVSICRFCVYTYMCAFICTHRYVSSGVCWH